VNSIAELVPNQGRNADSMLRLIETLRSEAMEPVPINAKRTRREVRG
jgi:alkyl hydroperoxide reductase subunit AhpC